MSWIECNQAINMGSTICVATQHSSAFFDMVHVLMR